MYKIFAHFLGHALSPECDIDSKTFHYKKFYISIVLNLLKLYIKYTKYCALKDIPLSGSCNCEYMINIER